jgi:hypothetical protein
MILFQGTVPITTPVYVPVRIKNGTIGVHISWADATSAAVITLQLSSLDPASPSAATWKDSGLTIVGPVASAAGSTLLNVENVRQNQAQLKIVPSAISTFDIRDQVG